VKHYSKSYRIFEVFNYMFMLFVCFITLYPFLYILATSVSVESAVSAGKVTIFPIGFHLKAYEAVMAGSGFWISYKNTVIYTMVGTSFSLIATTLLAYPLSKKHLRGRGFIVFLVVFTMFFHGGLIPNYLLVKGLGMIDTIWVMVIPGMINTFFMIILRTFFMALPDELEDAAAVDGLNPFMILVRIVLPLSKPALATIGLFYAVAEWNNWFSAFLYLNDKDRMPVTIFLKNVLSQLSYATDEMRHEEIQEVEANLRSATIIMVVTPILCVYPFIQKYFVKGVMLGSLKG
jgi:putative aldouronate transport system permease protein